MANKERGELDITLGDQTFTLVLTYGILTEIESVLGEGVFGLFGKAVAGSFSLRDMAVICHLAIPSSDEDDEPRPSLEEIGALILKQGTSSFIEPIGEFFRVAVMGGVKKKTTKKRSRS